VNPDQGDPPSRHDRHRRGNGWPDFAVRDRQRPPAFNVQSLSHGLKMSGGSALKENWHKVVHATSASYAAHGSIEVAASAAATVSCVSGTVLRWFDDMTGGPPTNFCSPRRSWPGLGVHRIGVSRPPRRRALSPRRFTIINRGHFISSSRRSGRPRRAVFTAIFEEGVRSVLALNRTGNNSPGRNKKPSPAFRAVVGEGMVLRTRPVARDAARVPCADTTITARPTVASSPRCIAEYGHPVERCVHRTKRHRLRSSKIAASPQRLEPHNKAHRDLSNKDCVFIGLDVRTGVAALQRRKAWSVSVPYGDDLSRPRCFARLLLRGRPTTCEDFVSVTE